MMIRIEWNLPSKNGPIGGNWDLSLIGYVRNVPRFYLFLNEEYDDIYLCAIKYGPYRWNMRLRDLCCYGPNDKIKTIDDLRSFANRHRASFIDYYEFKMGPLNVC
jgi:hypothetical protein